MYLYGAGGHAKVIADTLQENQISIEGVYDDNTSLQSFGNIPFLGVFVENGNPQQMIISIGSNSNRKKIALRLNAACTWGTAISKNASLSSSVHVGCGTVVMRGVSVNVDTKIGKHVILNTNCSIDHDCEISDFVHISPNATLAGSVSVGEGAQIGTGACIIPGIKIGKWATVGAGSVVIRNVPDYAVVVGNPARIIKYNKKEFESHENLNSNNN